MTSMTELDQNWVKILQAHVTFLNKHVSEIFSGHTFHCRAPGAFLAPPRPSVCWWGGCRRSADWPSRECWTTCVDLCHWAIYPPLERTNTHMNSPWDQQRKFENEIFFFTKIVIFICTGVMTKTVWKLLRWANKNLWTFEKYITFTFTDTIILSKESDVYCIRFIIQKWLHFQ